VLRDAARVVLLDASGRVLLMRWRLQTGASIWITPGGGLDPGESHAQAALRELAEEVGLRGVELGPWIWSREHVLRWNGRDILQRERFHLVRVEGHEVDRSGNDANELRVIEEIRWWTVEDIAASGEDFSPGGLPDLLAPLLAGRLPAEPLELGG
jgi:8-oxo-dGTP pyrophosphatase MutT (NUDIX family)